MSAYDLRFAAMGGIARVRLESPSYSRMDLLFHATRVRSFLRRFESALSRFRDDSELSRLNRDPRATVPASALMRELVQAARWAGEASGGLVDATLLAEVRHAGYAGSFNKNARPQLAEALAEAPPRRAATARVVTGIERFALTPDGSVSRPPGLALDGGGIGKGLAADLALRIVPIEIRAAVACGGDMAVRGAGGLAWDIAVAAAGDRPRPERLYLKDGGVATSGIDSRLWRGPDGTPRHHLIDPATGRPAWTGVLTATAVGPSALAAEVLAKTAVLSGPGRGRQLLAEHGGVLQLESGETVVVAASVDQGIKHQMGVAA